MTKRKKVVRQPSKAPEPPRYERLDAAVLSRGKPAARLRGVVFTERQKLGMHRMERLAELSLEKTREFIALTRYGNLTAVECEDRLLVLISGADELFKALIHQMARLYAIVEVKADVEGD